MEDSREAFAFELLGLLEDPVCEVFFGDEFMRHSLHGNCQNMRNADGSPHTAHTTNLVHAVYVADDAGS